MTPTVSELLLGNFLCLLEPPPPEAMGDFLSGRVVVTGMIAALAAQEAEKGADTRQWENTTIRDMLRQAAPTYGAQYANAAELTCSSQTISALDALNVTLRQALIALHIAAEDRGDVALHHDIIRLYRDMAQRHRLDLPTG